MKAYVDTSFLLALYLDEGEFTVGARRVAARLREEPVLTEFAEVEWEAGLGRRLFLGTLTPAEAAMARLQLQHDLEDGLFARAPIRATAWLPLARRLATRHAASLGVRSLDLLHVAAAKLSAATILLTFDERQAKLGLVEGFKVLP
jgi:predicted nucleic acid-binding protein